MCRQIYSLMRLTTSLPARDIKRASRDQFQRFSKIARLPRTSCITFDSIDLSLESWRADSDRRPADYKSAALPTELRQQYKRTPTARCRTSVLADEESDSSLTNWGETLGT